MIRPERLCKGDTIGVIAPASSASLEMVYKAVPFFEKMGLRVELGKHIDCGYGYLGGTDKERLDDFHQMIVNPWIKAIFFARGGYGTGRIVEQVDYDLIKDNPKIIWGYSDITYLHTAIQKKTDLVTFHGPMLASDIAKNGFDKFSACMFSQLFEPTKLQYPNAIGKLQTIVAGEASGKLTGGNLTLLVSTLGTPYEIDTESKLLILEDINEEPYRVDAMLNQLKLAGKLDEAAGILIGDFAKAEPKQEPSLSLKQVFQDYLGNLPCPVVNGFKIGHCFPHFSVPLGADATIQTASKSLCIRAGVK
ncbi:S66 peptidase family protein [Virgibacillus alimentarius]|uniref:Muramoyltetrapeptide carboxypeptidase n=1 Tax=Virgibacillus alimentarius TaxID=698769 RepID=A0ABS4S7A9_9BACI|nr:LD-carboxypeptidase [Virgibacillus alimentarius]MBP2257382.1 muramoyltetrapeptide carboxypeptidase [Virgibacillus alimentarius]